MKAHVFLFVACMPLLLLQACGGDSESPAPAPTPTPAPTPAPPPPPPPLPQEPTATEVGAAIGPVVSATIGATGGRLVSADGRFTLIVPAGALATNTRIGMQPITNGAHGGAGAGYRLTPDGQTFALPVQLRFNYNAADLRGTTPAALRVAYQDAQRYWRPLDNQVLDATVQTVTVESVHFTDFALYHEYSLKAERTDMLVNETNDLKMHQCTIREFGIIKAIYDCKPAPETITARLRNWSVNGDEDGDGPIGTVTATGRTTARYSSPPNAPPDSANPVAVSAERLLDAGSELLVANINVYDCPQGVNKPCPPKLTGFSNTVISDAFPSYRMRAAVEWHLDAAQSVGDVLVYTPSGSVYFAPVTLDPCINIEPAVRLLSPEDGQLTLLNSTRRFNGQGGKLWQATLHDDCNGTSMQIAAGGTWFVGDGTYSHESGYVGIVEGTHGHAGQTFTFKFIN